MVLFEVLAGQVIDVNDSNIKKKMPYIAHRDDLCAKFR
jgi:hypothetical protein